MKDGDQHGSLANLDSSPGTSGHKMGHGSSSKSSTLNSLAKMEGFLLQKTKLVFQLGK